MVANALMLTIAIVLGLGFWFMQRLTYFISYKSVLFRFYGTPILIYCAVNQYWRAVEPEQDALIGNEVGQPLHKPEAKSQDDGDGQHKCVRNHMCSLEGLVLAEISDREAQRIDRNKFV